MVSFTKTLGLLLLLLLCLSFSSHALSPVPPDSAIHLPPASQRCTEATVSWQTSREITNYTQRGSLVVLQEVNISNSSPAPVSGGYYIPSFFFGAGQQVGPGQFVVYADTGHVAKIQGLRPNTAYRADVFSYAEAGGNIPFDPPLYGDLGSSSTLYFTTPGCTTTTAPTNGSYGATAAIIDCSTAALTTNKGNGDGRLFVVQPVPSASDGPSLSTEPQPGQFYFPSNLYSQGQALGQGAYAVSLGPDSTAKVYGLAPGQTYKFVSYEYLTERTPGGVNTGQNPGYAAPVDTAYFTVPSCATTEPTAAASGAYQTDTTTTTARIEWTNGTGSGRLVIVRPLLSAGQLALPVQNTRYVASPVFGNGSRLAPDTYVVAAGPDNFVNISNLLPGTFYQASVYEYNVDATGTPTYLLSKAPASTLIQTYRLPYVAPVAPRNLRVTVNVPISYNGGLTQFTWRKGSGTHYVAMIREVRDNRPPLLSAIDGTEYNQFVNSEIEPRSLIGQGTYLLQRAAYRNDPADTIVYLRNASIGHEYEVVIYEYFIDPSAGPQYTGSDPLSFRAARIAPKLTGRLFSNAPALDWTIDAQYMSRSYTLESSPDSLSFQPLDLAVPLTSDSVTTMQRYSQQLATPITAPTYYRVVFRHSDGERVASNVIRLTAARPLPVTLVRFTGTVDVAGKALLRWSTAQEITSDYFEVERSVDAQTFRPVGRRAAAGTSAQARSYELADPTPLAGLTYYRLRQVDTDGTAHYSPIIALRPGAVSPSLEVWPNPVPRDEQAHLRLSGMKDFSTPVTLRIYSASTSQVLLVRELPAAATVEYSWSVASLPAGVYLVEVEASSGRRVTRLLVR